MAWYDYIPIVGPIIGAFDQGRNTPPPYEGYHPRQAAFANLHSQRVWQPFLEQGLSQLWGVPRATGEIDTGQQAEWRKRQQQLAGLLTQAAEGKAPSAAEIQMRQGLDAARAQAASMAASTPGVSPALAQRQAMAQQAQLGQQAVSQTSAMRAAEQARAQQALAGLLSGARGQDIGLAQAQAQLGLQAQALRDRLVQSFLGMGLSAAEADRQAQIALERMKQQDALARAGYGMQAFQTQQGYNQKLAGGLLSALGSVLSTPGILT